MILEACCHCREIRFPVRSRHPVPYQLCYCSICRHTQGGGGFAINLSAEAATLHRRGQKYIRIYRVHMRAPRHRNHISSAERHFCVLCGNPLWLFSPKWPQLLHPFAAAVETPLPVAPSHTRIMLAYKPAWVQTRLHRPDRQYDEYPDESIADWHRRHGLEHGLWAKLAVCVRQIMLHRTPAMWLDAAPETMKLCPATVLRDRR